MGFLKQIQRNRAGGSTQGDGILLKSNPTNHPHSPTTEVQDREALKKPADRQPPEKPAAHAGGEKQERRKRRDTSPHAGNTAASLRVIRKQQADKPAPALVGKITDSLPAWLKEGKKVNPNVELLCPEARRILNDILPTDEDAEIDLEEAIRESVQLAASALSGEVRISENDKDEATEELIKLLTGKGPLQPLYDDPAVTDIFIDNHEMIRCIRRGRAMETPFRFRSREEYKAYVNALLQSVDRNLNLSSPIVDCVLNDEFRSRINAVDPSCIEGDEPRLCLRIPRLQKITFYDILQTKTLPASLAAWLSEVVATGEANILILGPTGSGKTVFTTALLSAVRSDERIITIEDVPEIFIPTGQLEKLVSRPPNAQGEGEVKMPSLLRAALRRAPHRIVVGEIRDEEGRLFLRALETGHAGSIATIHAHNSRDSLWRLLDVVQAYETSPQESIMRRIGRSVDMTITMRKAEDGKPCLYEVSEVLPSIEGEFQVQPIVTFHGIVQGKRVWKIAHTRSKWLDYIRSRGVELKPGPSLWTNDQIEANEQELHGGS